MPEKRVKHDIKKDKTSQSEEQYYGEKGKYGQNEQHYRRTDTKTK